MPQDGRFSVQPRGSLRITPPDIKRTRRRLPHWSLEGATYFITFRLANGVLTSHEINLVLEHIRDGDPQYYDLLAIVVMPDHAHLLITPGDGYTLSRIMKGIKGASARKVNNSRKSTGRIWQDESLDRIIRDDGELLEKLRYMLHNPVKVGLSDDGWSYHGFCCKTEEHRDSQ
jgi:REP element-mobilizing transposase RayT